MPKIVGYVPTPTIVSSVSHFLSVIISALIAVVDSSSTMLAMPTTTQARHAYQVVQMACSPTSLAPPTVVPNVFPRVSSAVVPNNVCHAKMVKCTMLKISVV